jgi:hypothetical protein
MTKNEKLIASLPTVKDVFDVEFKAPAFFHVESPNVLRISADQPQSYLFLDYYGEYRGGYSWIHPDLIKWAEDHKGYWEWQNPSNIAFYPL